MDTGALLQLLHLLFLYVTTQTAEGSSAYLYSNTSNTAPGTRDYESNASLPLFPPGLVPVLTQALCFGFPAPVGDHIWSEPIPKPLTLSCPEDTHITIQGAFYLRPDIRGDQCTSDVGCYGDTCCCGPWTGANCSVDIGSTYQSVYSGLLEECNNTTQCIANVTAQPLDDKCTVSGCNSAGRDRTGRCWARWIQVSYVCTESWVLVTKAAPVQDSPYTSSPGPVIAQFMWLPVGISVGAVAVVVLILIVIGLVCVRKKNRASRRLQGHDTSASFLQLEQNTSYNHENPPHNHSMPGVNNNQENPSHNNKKLQFVESKAYVPPSMTDMESEPLPNGRHSNDYKGYQDIEDNVSEVVMTDNNYYESVTDTPGPSAGEELEVKPPDDEWGDILKELGLDTDQPENLYEPLASCVSVKPEDPAGNQSKREWTPTDTSLNTSNSAGVNSGNQFNRGQTLLDTSFSYPSGDVNPGNQFNRGQTLMSTSFTSPSSGGPESQPYTYTYPYSPSQRRQREPLPGEIP